MIARFMSFYKPGVTGRLAVPQFIEREGYAEGDHGDHGGARVLIMRGGCGSHQPRGVIPDSGSASRRKMACRGLASGPWTTGQQGHGVERWAFGSGSGKRECAALRRWAVGLRGAGGRYARGLLSGRAKRTDVALEWHAGRVR